MSPLRKSSNAYLGPTLDTSISLPPISSNESSRPCFFGVRGLSASDGIVNANASHRLYEAIEEYSDQLIGLVGLRTIFWTRWREQLCVSASKEPLRPSHGLVMRSGTIGRDCDEA